MPLFWCSGPIGISMGYIILTTIAQLQAELAYHRFVIMNYNAAVSHGFVTYNLQNMAEEHARLGRIKLRRLGWLRGLLI